MALFSYNVYYDYCFIQRCNSAAERSENGEGNTADSTTGGTLVGCHANTLVAIITGGMVARHYSPWTAVFV